MLDLFSGYLLIIIALFSTNLGLFYRNLKNNVEIYSVITAIILFFTLIISKFFTKNLMDCFGYIFLLVAVVNFMIFIYYLRNNESRLIKSTVFISILFYIQSFLLSSQIANIDSLLFSLFSLVIIIASYIVSRILIYAKREYPIIIGEFMTLSSILIFIFGLTYHSTLNLDYSIFSPFLILTPTYQLIYIVIAVIVGLIIGSYLNDMKR